MGNSVSRPSCLGDRSRKSERFLKECLKKEAIVRNNGDPGTDSGDKKPYEPATEKELNASPTSSGSWTSNPPPKHNNTDGHNGTLRIRTPKSTPDHRGNAWTPQRGTLQRASGSSCSWKPLASREVTEVTEVTETIVTEIVEVTQYPTGDKSGEPIVTRTVKVLTERGGELSEVQTSREAQTESQYRRGQWDKLGKTVPQRALILPDWPGNEPPESLETVLGWVSDMEELTEAQKSPSCEVKVVKAQLQEQKLLQRLLDERRPRIERVLVDKKTPTQLLPIEAGEREGPPSPLSELQDRWDSLLQKAEARHRQLERITPVAQDFQGSLDSFQDWVNATERKLVELWRANGSKSQINEAYQEIQLLSEDVHSKPGDLDGVLEKGQMLLELVAGK
ncbi:microtubule-actin cross-linking factor 1, isoforms 6/7-like [Spea bombifrons]|uniref:microtubule-actin cross-linking factor 1, isoforms 6/7-like n=1 Tax=Spea bombifrons TaxID=233779 RepID=UPI00234B9063|nr:microtubule-actin cross-linking factor 1, isoforms 6/7-like [Spea bombifrons]